MNVLGMLFRSRHAHPGVVVEEALDFSKCIECGQVRQQGMALGGWLLHMCLEAPRWGHTRHWAYPTASSAGR